MKKAAKCLIRLAASDVVRRHDILKWSPRQESNLYLPLRRRPFYPLNYGEHRPAPREAVSEAARIVA